MRSFILAALAFTSAVHAAGPQWKAGSPSATSGLNLVQEPGSAYTLTGTGANAVATVTPVKDMYRRASFLVRITGAVPARTWLQVEFLDRGFNLIQASLPGVDAKKGGVRDYWGIPRLNTGKFRTAWFELENPGTDIKLEGVEHIRSLSLATSAPPRDPIPSVAPALQLKRPLDLVMSAGADARTIDGLPQSLNSLRNMLPLIKALGFNGLESYVKWGFVERTPGVYDWSFYDAVVAEMEKHGLKWFPLLIVGSAYALPDWVHQSKELPGYACLEHGVTIDIPTIFHPRQVPYVRRFLGEFGRHYEPRNVLLGVRLGPTANYGEAQYPATGSWGYRWGGIHTHIGYWVGDPGAAVAFREWTRARYSTVSALNEAWFTRYTSFDEVKPFLPENAQSPRMRVDFTTWYMDAMSDWCEKWAVWAKEGMPNTHIYQSSGGWGAVPIGTDYTAQAKAMSKLKGGIRLTNENDSYLNNFSTTRMASSAARFYGAMLGYEPAGFGSARGVMARLYNTYTNGADHLFYYYGNFFSNDQATALWLKHAALLDQRAKPVTQVAVFYPDTANKLSDEVLRYRQASTFFERVQALRRVTDFDYASEQMILDGALDRYKALVFLWGRVAPKEVIERIDRWVKAGGIILYPERQQQREGLLGTPEGDNDTAQSWAKARTGEGKFLLYNGYSEPSQHYIDWVRDTLREMPQLTPAFRAALKIRGGNQTFWSLNSNGSLALLNYDDKPATVTLPDGKLVTLPAYNVVTR